MKKSTISINIFLLFLIFQLLGCKENLEIIDNLGDANYTLINQDSITANFPSLLKDKIGVVGYIFTNCPDVCPLTTNNMRLIRERVEKEKIENVEFVSISFDPEVDKPSVLKKFSELHDVNFNNWEFLTGDKSIIDKLMKEVGVIAIVGDSTTFQDGSKTYYYIHTDRIQLIDQEGRIRKNYPGSKANIDEIVNDIKKL